MNNFRINSKFLFYKFFYTFSLQFICFPFSSITHNTFFCRASFVINPVIHFVYWEEHLYWFTYKYLDVGIVVGPVSFVEIAIGDNQGNNIILPGEMWQTFIERRVDIERLVQSFAPSSVRDLVIEIVKMRNMNVVKLSLRETCLYMKRWILHVRTQTLQRERIFWTVPVCAYR